MQWRELWTGWCIGWALLFLTIAWWLYPINLALAAIAIAGIPAGNIAFRKNVSRRHSRIPTRGARRNPVKHEE